MSRIFNTLLLFTFLSFVSYKSTGTNIAAGQIALLTVNSDQNDSFVFVLLVDISGTTELKFTDQGWDTLTNSFSTGSEGLITWTYTGSLTCGTQISINHPSSTTPTTSMGSVVKAGSFNLATTGDQLLVYQGSAVSPTFIYAFNFISGGWDVAVGASTANTNIPDGLNDGVNAFTVASHFDNWRYKCVTLCGTPSQILASFMISSNYDSNDDTAYISFPYCSSFTCITLPDVPTLTAANVCLGESATINITGNLNSASKWYLYAGSCGGTAIDSTTGSSFSVNPSVNTTYFVRGIGNCITPGSCGSVAIVVNPLPIATITANQISCNAAADGLAFVVASTGSAPYAYLWSTTSTNDSIVNLTPGSYSVIVTDDSTCQGFDTVVITQPAALGGTVTSYSCPSSNGSITIGSVSGGYGTYEYTINGGSSWQSSGSFTGLSGGTYDVRMRDAANPTCELTLNGSLTLTNSDNTPNSHMCRITCSGS